MPLPGGGYAAVQKIPSRDLATFVERAIDCILPPCGEISLGKQLLKSTGTGRSMMVDLRCFSW